LTEKNGRGKGDEGERQQLARLRVALKRLRARTHPEFENMTIIRTARKAFCER